tara:strand:- start:14077 stop:15093 length:1017 start_codon:yes stop_codon:yes gene_type:complete
MTDLDDDWENFLDNDNLIDNRIEEKNNIISDDINEDIPKSSDLYISTKTKITYLNINNIDLYDVFWKIPIMEYGQMKNGVIKKQMKFNLQSEEQLANVNEQLNNEDYYKVDVIYSNQCNHGKTKIFKEVRKINVGLCKKDIISYRSKQKSAFYNCFVMILRLNDNKNFKEIHVKVFNTGKLEIPGIQCEILYQKTLELVVNILQNIITHVKLNIPEHSETVLVNSNFRCGYYIDREKMYKILKYQYNINATYDACSYPGIQCKYNIDNECTISFMIFRTGSVLIVGKCEMESLYKVYNFLKEMLIKEYSNVNICENNMDIEKKIEKKVKIRKKIIYIH